LLAVLALRCGEIVDTDRLIDLVWGPAEPPAANTVQTNVSYLRRVLGLPIMARAAGYVLELPDDGTDVLVAERIIRQQLHATDPADQAQQLRGALALWRGRPLTGIVDRAWASDEIHRIGQLWRHAKQCLIDAELTIGNHTQLLPELQRLIEEYPNDEQLYGQLMLALYRAGRQVDALTIYRRVQHTLANELGIDPGQALRDLHAAILRQDTSLNLPLPSTEGAPSTTPLSERETLSTLMEAAALDGLAVFRRAHASGRHDGDVEAMAADVLALAGTWLQERRGGTAAAIVQARLRHALTLVNPASSLAQRLRARLVAEADFAKGECTGILTMVEESQTWTDLQARADVLTAALQCLQGPDDGPRRGQLAADLIGLSVHTGREDDLLVGTMMMTSTMFLEADVRAERSLAELRALALDCGHNGAKLTVSSIDVTLAVRAGRLADAERMAQECAREGRLARHPDADNWHAAHLIMIRWFQGRTPELIPLLEEIVNSPTLTTVDYSYLPALAMAQALAGDRRAAASTMARLRQHGLATLPRTCNWITIMPGVVTTARILGDIEAATEAYELVLPYAHRPIMAGLGLTCFGSVHTTLGTACLTIGDLDQAVEHYRLGIRDNEVLGHWPAVAHSRQLYARALSHRGGPDDTAASDVAYAAAAEDARLIGIPLTTRSAPHPTVTLRAYTPAEGAVGAGVGVTTTAPYPQLSPG
jgi:DNA-binding SARP family transcriptional activator